MLELDIHDFMLCKEVELPAFNRNNYLYEIKFDGVRTYAFIEHGKVVKMLTRSNHNRLEDRFAHLKEDTFYAKSMVLDGELCVFDEKRGISRLNLVSSSAFWKKAVFIAFDVLFYDGTDLRNLPFSERRTILERIFSERKYEHFILSPQFKTFEGLWRVVIDKELEGVIGKTPNSTYMGSRTLNWIKLKNWKYIERKVEKYEITENNGFVIYVKLDNGNYQKVVVNGTTESNFIKEKVDNNLEVSVVLRYLHEEDKGLRELVFYKIK